LEGLTAASNPPRTDELVEEHTSLMVRYPKPLGDESSAEKPGPCRVIKSDPKVVFRRWHRWQRCCGWWLSFRLSFTSKDDRRSLGQQGKPKDDADLEYPSA
jgi:hypothetical protein